MYRLFILLALLMVAGSLPVFGGTYDYTSVTYYAERLKEKDNPNELLRNLIEYYNEPLDLNTSNADLTKMEQIVILLRKHQANFISPFRLPKKETYDDEGAMAYTPDPAEGLTPLEYALQLGNVHFIEALLKHAPGQTKGTVVGKVFAIKDTSVEVMIANQGQIKTEVLAIHGEKGAKVPCYVKQTFHTKIVCTIGPRDLNKVQQGALAVLGATYRHYSLAATRKLFSALLAADISTEGVRAAIDAGAVVNARVQINHKLPGINTESTDVHLPETGSALLIAIFRDKPDIADLLIRQGAEYAGRRPGNKTISSSEFDIREAPWDEISAVFYLKRTAILEVILTHGLGQRQYAVINDDGDYEFNWLAFAAENNLLEAIRRLLGAGWDPNFANNRYREAGIGRRENPYGNPLLAAELSNNIEAAELLRKHGADYGALGPRAEDEIWRIETEKLTVGDFGLELSAVRRQYDSVRKKEFFSADCTLQIDTISDDYPKELAIRDAVAEYYIGKQNRNTFQTSLGRSKKLVGDLKIIWYEFKNCLYGENRSNTSLTVYSVVNDKPGKQMQTFSIPFKVKQEIETNQENN